MLCVEPVENPVAVALLRVHRSMVNPVSLSSSTVLEITFFVSFARGKWRCRYAVHRSSLQMKVGDNCEWSMTKGWFDSTVRLACGAATHTAARHTATQWQALRDGVWCDEWKGERPGRKRAGKGMTHRPRMLLDWWEGGDIKGNFVHTKIQSYPYVCTWTKDAVGVQSGVLLNCNGTSPISWEVVVFLINFEFIMSWF